METNCRIKEDKIIHPFAYRTHTHSLGKVVSGYHIREDKNGNQTWTLLGKRDPLTPQMFVPVFNSDPIKPGDIVVLILDCIETNISYFDVLFLTIGS